MQKEETSLRPPYTIQCSIKQLLEATGSFSLERVRFLLPYNSPTHPLQRKPEAI
jgi:hypothetical protein